MARPRLVMSPPSLISRCSTRARLGKTQSTTSRGPPSQAISWADSRRAVNLASITSSSSCHRRPQRSRLPRVRLAYRTRGRTSPPFSLSFSLPVILVSFFFVTILPLDFTVLYLYVPHDHESDVSTSRSRCSNPRHVHLRIFIHSCMRT